MIVSFLVRNYRSILEEELDFRFSEGKAPNGHKEADYFTFLSEKKVRCVPVLAIFGANGSGKSNILKTIGELVDIVRNGSIEGKYHPNKLNKKYDTTTFELSFTTNGNRYTYSIEYDDNQIKEECLQKNNKLLFKTSELIKDKTPSNSIKKVFFDSCMDQSVFKKPLITMLKRWLSGLTDVSIAYDYIERSLIYIPNNSFPAPLSINMLSDSPRKPDKAFNEIVEYLRKMDFNVSAVEMTLRRNCLKIERYPDGHEVSNWADDITVYHEGILGKKVGLALAEESMGTQLLFGLLGVILSALKEGKVLFVDELDKSLHPFILRYLVRLFKDKSINKRQAQLIYSTHDTSILEDELLRISEAAFVTNTLILGTEIKRLCDYEGVTNSDNFRKMYINCQLGSVPFTKL